MIRLFLVILILTSVLSIGVPFENLIGDIVFKQLRLFGIDVSMTPLTTDMSMMSDKNHLPLYKSKLYLDLKFLDGEVQTVKPSDLNLYLHKLPIILYYEILGYGGEMPEGKVFLCRSFELLTKKKVLSFKVWADNNYERNRFNEDQICFF